MFLKFNFTAKYFWGKILWDNILFSPSPNSNAPMSRSGVLGLNIFVELQSYVRDHGDFVDEEDIAMDTPNSRQQRRRTAPQDSEF